MTDDSINLSRDDVAAAVDYLEGLQVIAYRLNDERRGADELDDMTDQLANWEGRAGAWAPLRYQAGEGLGWRYVADAAGELRERLLSTLRPDEGGES